MPLLASRRPAASASLRRTAACRNALFWVAAWGALAPLVAPAVAAFDSPGAVLPLDGGEKLVGVASCSSSLCHGAVGGGAGRGVRLDEYRVWLRDDPHATRAFRVLASERSGGIVARLGWERPATAEPRCLSCHATNVSESRRGERFDPEEERQSGITCEACHGGAELWIKSHTKEGATHAANLREGMFPTDQIAPRAELCLSCHLGDGKRARFVTHRMMAAGHPRIGFELATFTLTQPAHFAVDEDYRRRGKATASAAKTWAIGQAVAARQWLGLVAEPDLNHEGAWPEFTLYDCYSCHRLIGSAQGGGEPGRLGLPHLALESLGLARIAVDAVAPASASALRALAEEIARRNSDGGMAAASATAAKGRATLDEAVVALEGWEPETDGASLRRILAAIVQESIAGGPSYAQAADRYMAAQSILSTIENADELRGDATAAEARAALRHKLDPLYKLVLTDSAYAPDAFRGELARLSGPAR